MKTTKQVLGILVCVMLLASCDQKASPSREEFQEETSFSMLQNEITSLDARFEQKNATQLRGFWSDLWTSVTQFFSDCGSVVVADVVGLAENTSVTISPSSSGEPSVSIAVNVGKAVSASVATAKEVFSSSEQTEKTISWGKWQAKPSYSMEYTGSVVGEAHNEIIKELCELYKDKTLEEVSDEQMYQDILTLTLKYYNLSSSAVDKGVWKTFQTSAERIRSEVAHKTPEEAISYLRAYPRGDVKELNIIADYLVKVKSLPTEELRKEYAKEFSQTVKQSTVSKLSKQTIMNATATGLNSIALWEQK